jgi:DNA repair protein RadD
MNRWPHQIRCVQETLEAIRRGERRVCLSSPTGGGKTLMLCDLAQHYLESGRKVVLYTDRRALLEQTSEKLKGAGLEHGIRAAGYWQEADHHFQVSSLQTEWSRSYVGQKKRLIRAGANEGEAHVGAMERSSAWGLHDADLVLIDEAHNQNNPRARGILEAHYQAGADIVGLTATPLGIGDLFDCLIVAGNTSELRECGALVRAVHYGPDEPDLKGIKSPLGEDLTEKQAVKAMMRNGIFGRVLGNFNAINPERRPSILFAPGVRESVWFAERFAEAGISAAHVDGEDVWINGKWIKASRQARADILGGSRDGEIVVLCNRIVLREGIDAPWLSHGIHATVFGSLQSFLQAGGRLLRSHPDLSQVTIQDHGGNWWRHGSLNADREWRLELTNSIASGLRAERIRNHEEKPPWRCPKCQAIGVGGLCLCGYVRPPGKSGRVVVQQDGTLKELHGDIFKPRRVYGGANGPALWKRMYFRSLTVKGKKTFSQAMALFARENNFGWPGKDWPFMPREPFDMFRLVSDVPRERLVPEC